MKCYNTRTHRLFNILKILHTISGKINKNSIMIFSSINNNKILPHHPIQRFTCSQASNLKIKKKHLKNSPQFITIQEQIFQLFTSKFHTVLFTQYFILSSFTQLLYQITFTPHPLITTQFKQPIYT